MQLHIGIDDTDSKQGGCTTYIGARLVEKLSTLPGVRFTDYPNIIRLNPNIPLKTRGNAAVALRLAVQNPAYDLIRDITLLEIEENSRIGSPGTDPAVVFAKGPLSPSITRFSERALYDVLSAREAISLLRSTNASAAAYGSKLGLVGALAAVGQTLIGDHTFELIAYRTRKTRGTQRRVDEESVKRMDRATSPMTFNNYDYENERVLITPHGPDPVLFGIRGENAEIVNEAFRSVKSHEPIERWVIFRTNHGTDAHLKALPQSHDLKPHRPMAIRGIISDSPKRTVGGHVFMKLEAGWRTLTCAAYEPTGKFRGVISELQSGDEVTAYGRLREDPVGRFPTINLEKIMIHRLADKVGTVNPTCPACGKRLKSAGRDQGYKCVRCSFRVRAAKKRISREPRRIQTGVYLPTLKAHRHLTKPLSRYGREKSWDHGPPVGSWHCP